MITRIKLKNWRCHSDSDLEFSPGTNALVGAIGSGKSSVLNAICFSLFGTFPDLQTRKVKLDDLIMNKPSLEDTAEIMTDFTIDGKNYSVMRIIERGKGTTYSELREGEKLIDSPNSQRVTELVEKIFKVDYELFSKAIYSEQNGLDYFLRVPRGERMRRIDNLLMIDKFEKARGYIISIRNKLTERMLGKQSMIETIDLNEVKKIVEKLNKELKDLKNSMNDTSRSLKDIEEKRTKSEKELKDLELLNDSFTNFEQQKKSLESLIQENRMIIEEIKKTVKEEPENIREKLEKSTERIKSLEKDMKKKRDEYEKLTNLISEQKTKLDFLQKEKINDLEEKIEKKLRIKERIIKITKKYGEDPSRKLKEEEKKLEKEKERITRLFTILEDTKTTLKKVQELKDRCPVCSSDLTKERRESLIKEQKEKLKTTEADLEKTREKKRSNEEKIKELQEIVSVFTQYSKDIADMKDLTSKLKELKKTRSETEKIIQKKKEEYDILKKQISDVENDLTKEKKNKQELETILSKLSELVMKKIRLKGFGSQKNKLEQEMDGVKEKIGKRNLQEERSRFRTIISEYSKLQEKLSGLESLIEEKENRFSEQTEKLKLVETQKREILRMEKIIKDLRIFEKALEKTQVQLRKKFIDTVNYSMNQLWPSLYPYDDFTGIRLDIQGKDYVLQLQTKRGWVDVEGVASGGERSIACLALRIAFAIVLAPQLRILILDEPTANLDRSAINVLAMTLRERIDEFIEQCFLITHQSELEEAVNARAYRLERDKETDAPTRITVLN